MIYRALTFKNQTREKTPIFRSFLLCMKTETVAKLKTTSSPTKKVGCSIKNTKKEQW